jgi:hypothetical protein
MTLSDLASIGSLVSGIAVLASLIFVGLQLRQNTQAVRAEASQAHSQNWQNIVTPIIDNGEVARLWRLCLGSINDLTDDENVRFLSLASGIFRFWEGSRLQWRHGQLDTEHWQYVERQIEDVAGASGIKDYWVKRGHWHSTEFAKWYETLSSGTTGREFCERTGTLKATPN